MNYVDNSLWMYKAFRRTVASAIDMDTEEEKANENAFASEYVSVIMALRESNESLEHLRRRLRNANDELDLQRNEIAALNRALRALRRRANRNDWRVPKDRNGEENAIPSAEKVISTSENQVAKKLHAEIRSLKTQANVAVVEYDKKLKNLSDSIEGIRNSLSSTAKVNDWLAAGGKVHGNATNRALEYIITK